MKNEKEYDVGVISFNLNTVLHNYGAALHSFAFQKYLNSINVNNVIVDYTRFSYFKKLQEVFKDKPCKNLPFLLCSIIKYIKFNRFFNKHVVLTKNKYTKETIKNINNINRFCCETDVTWSCFKDGYDRAFLCDYENMKNKENVAYSVDFGSKEISEENKILLLKYSKNFKYISIRNPYRLEEFKKIVNRDDIIATIDPVFLLDKCEWQPYVHVPNYSKDFVFVYNCKENNSNMVRAAKAFAKENNLKIKIVHCFDKKACYKKAKPPTPMSIESFLGHIKSCRYFFTNSYHGICFAMIFEKDFFAYARIGNNQKILTALKLGGLENRFVENDTLNKNPIDYSEVNKNLQIHINKSKKWLDIAFKKEN